MPAHQQISAGYANEDPLMYRFYFVLCPICLQPAGITQLLEGKGEECGLMWVPGVGCGEQ